MTKNPIRYLPLLMAAIALSSLGHAQGPATTNRKPAGLNQNNRPTANASVVAVGMNPVTQLMKKIPSKPEPLVFKPAPGDKNTRMAEFTTPDGLRMRAFTNGPNSIRFAPADQSQGLGQIIVSGPNVVALLSGGTHSGAGGATGPGGGVDAFTSVLGAIRDALGTLFGGQKKLKNCSTTITITIGDTGITKTEIVSRCDIS